MSSADHNRLLTPEEREARKQDVFWHSQMEGVKGSFIWGAAAAGAHVALQQFWPVYQRVNWRIKLFAGSSAAVAGYWIRAEQAHLEKMSVIADDDDRRRQAVDDAYRASRTSMRS